MIMTLKNQSIGSGVIIEAESGYSNKQSCY